MFKKLKDTYIEHSISRAQGFRRQKNLEIEQHSEKPSDRKTNENIERVH